ncbi:hypothetical protein MKS88_000789 [Plasmodium brasilianum]|uniref:Uncharacterized protein n=1 Tax=Plasmodium brasilianum TaxID=5824 RepID=A0ACB9YG66_PLABR|nr:hypothetical protein MKS88_000789 [Plasmodium brasilianum]
MPKILRKYYFLYSEFFINFLEHDIFILKLDVRKSRLLYSETNVNHNALSTSLKEDAIKIANEDEYTFRNRLNTLMENDYSLEDITTLLHDDEVEISSNSLKFKNEFENFNIQ